MSSTASEFLDGAPKGLFVDNDFVEASGEETLTAVDPATGAVLGSVAVAEPADVDLAVVRARAAFERGPWPGMTSSERGRLLWRLGELIERHKDELAMLETLNNGKPITHATRDDLPQVADMFPLLRRLRDEELRPDDPRLGPRNVHIHAA